MNCTRCGKNVPLHSKVCPNCGLDNPMYQPRPQEQEPPRAQTWQAPQPPVTPPPVRTQPAPSQPAVATQVQTAPAKKKSSWMSWLILAAVVVGIVFLVQSCNASQLEGTWTGTDGLSMTFSDDENGYFMDSRALSSANKIINFTYFTDGDVLEIKTETTLFINSEVVRFRYEISGDTLTLTELGTNVVTTFQKK